MAKRKIIIFIFIIISVLIILLHKTLLIDAAKYLIVEDKLKKADVIVVLAGELTGERLSHAVKLYKDGYSEKLLLTGSSSCMYDTATAMKQQALNQGVPEEAILLEEKSKSTYENALFSKSIIEEQGFSSLILVTSTYHSRRARFIFEKTYKILNLDIVSSPAAVPYFNTNNWWKDKKGIKTLVEEYIKLLGYYVKY